MTSTTAAVTATSIYLAGKIGKNDWRHDIVRDLLGAWGSDGLTPSPEWPVATRAVVDRFDYVGPYFMGDDHGCGRGPSTHGCGTDEGMCGGAYPTPGRAGVRDLCLAAIRRADIFFAWLDDPSAHGTLVEIGYARALGKTIVIAAPELPEDTFDDLWFGFSLADWKFKAPTPRAALEQLTAAIPRLDSPIEQAFWMEYYTTWRHGVLKGLVAQYPVLDGRYRLDFALPDQKVGIELDGYTYHSSREAFIRDRQRQRNLEAAGWRIIRFSGAEINANVAACLGQAMALVATFRTPEQP